MKLALVATTWISGVAYSGVVTPDAVENAWRIQNQNFILGEWCGARDIWWKGDIVPDRVYAPPASGIPTSIDLADFYKACRIHDEGYWTYQAKKSEVDQAFLARLKHECRVAYHTIIEKPHYVSCIGIAHLYYEVMLPFSAESWRDGQNEARYTVELLQVELENRGISYEANKNYFHQRIGKRCADENTTGACNSQKVVQLIVKNDLP